MAINVKPFGDRVLGEVASMGQLLRVVQRAGEGNLLRVEEYLAREKDRGVAVSEEE